MTTTKTNEPWHDDLGLIEIMPEGLSPADQQAWAPFRNVTVGRDRYEFVLIDEELGHWSPGMLRTCHLLRVEAYHRHFHHRFYSTRHDVAVNHIEQGIFAVQAAYHHMRAYLIGMLGEAATDEAVPPLPCHIQVLFDSVPDEQAAKHLPFHDFMLPNIWYIGCLTHHEGVYRLPQDGLDWDYDRHEWALRVRALWDEHHGDKIAEYLGGS